MSISTTVTWDDNDDIHDRAKALLIGKESMPQFIYRATVEKVNRMETRDEKSRLKLLQRDIEALRPIVEAIIKEIPNG